MRKSREEEIKKGIIVLFAVLICAAVVFGVFNATKPGRGNLYIEVRNYTGSSISYEYFIGHGYMGSDIVYSFEKVIHTVSVTEGTHTVTVSVIGGSSRSQTKYVPAGGSATMVFEYR